MLDSLSTELLEHIWTFVHKSDLSSSRLVCRSLYNVATAAFGRAWLATVETDLSEEGLHRLENIAGHEIFRFSVCRLRIVRGFPRRVGGDPVWPFFLSEMTWPPLGGERIWPRLASSAVNLSSVMVRKFQDIVRRLDTCTTFEVCDRPDDKTVDRVATFGLSPADALRVALSVMTTGARPIQTLRIYFDRQSAYSDAKHLSSITTNPTLFSSLQDLDIQWNIGDDVAEQVVYMITLAKRLKRLRLNFVLTEHINRFFHLLAAAPTLPPIANLRIGSIIKVSYTALVNVILRFQGSLRSLHIGHIGLETCDWDTLFKELSRHEFSYLESIAICFVRAPQPPDHFSIGYLYFCPLRLKQETLEKCGGIFEFAIGPNRDKWRVHSVRYSGPRMGMVLALKALANDSHYIMSRITRSPSPGLPNMKTFTGDRVGHLVPRFSQMETWNGFNV